MLPLWVFVTCSRVNFSVSLTRRLSFQYWPRWRLLKNGNRAWTAILHFARSLSAQCISIYRVYGPYSRTPCWKRCLDIRWKTLHEFVNETLQCTFSWSNTVKVIELRKMGWAEDVARMWEKLAWSVLVKAPRGKRSPERTRYRWEANNELDERVCQGFSYRGKVAESWSWTTILVYCRDTMCV